MIVMKLAISIVQFAMHVLGFYCPVGVQFTKEMGYISARIATEAVTHSSVHLGDLR